MIGAQRLEVTEFDCSIMFLVSEFCDVRQWGQVVGGGCVT